MKVGSSTTCCFTSLPTADGCTNSPSVNTQSTEFAKENVWTYSYRVKSQDKMASSWSSLTLEERV